MSRNPQYSLAVPSPSQSHFESIPFLPSSPLLEKHAAPSPHAPPQHKLSCARLFLTGAALAGAVWGVLLLLPTPQLVEELSDTPLSVSVLSTSTSAPSPWTLTPAPGASAIPLSPAALSTTCAAVANHTMHATHLGQRPTFLDPTSNLTAPHCPGTLTFILPAAPHGLAEILLQLFTAHSLAAAQNRTFHIDDSAWAWGRLSSYLQAPAHTADAACAPPPRAQLLPCPDDAKHRVVTHSLRRWVFGHAFHHRFEVATAAGTARQQRIWELAAAGMARFVPADAVARVVEQRVQALGERNWTAVAVRRGDGKTRTWRWRKGWLPVAAYFHAAERPVTGKGVLVMSDDADVYAAPELREAEAAVVSGGGVMGGWRARDMEKMSREEKEKVGREWLAELMVVAEVATEVRCMGGSATCRLLGVGLGWERLKSGWRDVDGGWGWKGVQW
ncbi:hypothetical protein EDC01DRAFT_729824 [Geopyxis carbonaria]|nr:hypothetical protein EDC01DRAFT_729824 [Geopyxis carbonaria]